MRARVRARLPGSHLRGRSRVWHELRLLCERRQLRCHGGRLQTAPSRARLSAFVASAPPSPRSVLKVTNESPLAPQAGEASQTLRSVPTPARGWSMFQLGILAATTLVGFVVGYGVLFATAIN